VSEPTISIDEHLIAEIADEMDLREPNRDALATLAGRLSVWQNSDAKGTPEFVFDLATGVGKTYLMVGAINYLARFGVRNFVVFVPRTAILNKTIDNLTPGHRKSVVDNLPFDLTVVRVGKDHDDLASPAVAAAIEDGGTVKVYVVTVQSFAGRESDAKRKAHDFREELGAAFYETLKNLDDLVVFADEHHTYYGTSFSNAVRGLHPMCLVGLTATPDEKTPDRQIVYRYPLANAIEDRHVKRPVIVGRSDELTDDRTKLYDGVVLLRAKQQVADRFADMTGAPQRNLLMLVVAEDIAEAERIEALLQEPDFFGGEYAGKVLRVDSSQPEVALEALADIEDRASPYRVVVSVAMLKEGWDVATVAVICSLRPSVSDLLTEQTLGRGLRLPWGNWVDVALLNELDVVAHASYEKVLEQARALNERRVDWRTWLREQEALLSEQAANAASEEAKRRARAEVAKLAGTTAAASAPTDTDTSTSTQPTGYEGSSETPSWAEDLRLIGDRIGEVESAAAPDEDGPLRPHLSRGQVLIPVIKVQERADASYELSDVLAQDPDAFRKLGERFARDPQGTLRRSAVVAKTEIGDDGIAVTRVRTVPAETKIVSDATPPPLDEVREHLVSVVLASNYSTSRLEDRHTAQDIIDRLAAGAGDKASSLGAYLDQVSGALLHEIGRVVGQITPETQRTELVAHRAIDWERPRAPEISDDPLGAFDTKKKDMVGYTGWAKHLYDEARFHSSTERDAAVAVDTSDDVEFWVRLHNGDLPVAWAGDGKVRNYNPDLLVVETPQQTPSGAKRMCWLVEVKADVADEHEDVKAKHAAAARWATKANARHSGEAWNVLRVTQTDVRNAKGSWASLKQLGRKAL
jgi:type III restriction enzyme